MIAPTLLAAVLVLAAGPSGDVEPSELARRADLLGREIVVDDRIRFFLESRRGQGYDELFLKRTEVVFRLPPRLKLDRSPSEPVARVRGTLVEQDGRRVFDVSAIEFLPNDLDRFGREMARLRPNDFVGKRQWALWAQRRGHELNEPRLEALGVGLEGEALWIESTQPDADPLALAERAASRPIPAPTRNALIHRGLRDRVATARTVADREELAGRIGRMLPDSLIPQGVGTIDATLRDAYAKDPATTYRDAPASARSAFDRKLLADVIQSGLEQQVRDEPSRANALADEATSRLPDRPALAEMLRRRGLDEAEVRAPSMRQSEVEDLARVFREGGQEGRARLLLQTWLGDRRKNRLSASDAEGRVLLALNYDRLLGDRASAIDLLREAIAIDPGSKPTTEAFLRMGFRKGEAGWIDPRAERATATEPGPERPATTAVVPLAGDSLRGLTRDQVRARLGGKPDRIARSATQGQCVEQWIYSNARGTQIVNFAIESTSAEPRAMSYYSDTR